jgi:hypothetical protein
MKSSRKTLRDFFLMSNSCFAIRISGAAVPARMPLRQSGYKKNADASSGEGHNENNASVVRI